MRALGSVQLGNRCQIPSAAGENLGNAEHFTAAELASNALAIGCQNLDETGLHKEEMGCHLAWPKQGLAMKEQHACGALHVRSPCQSPLCDLSGNRP